MIQISSFLPKAFLEKACFSNGENQMDILLMEESQGQRDSVTTG